MAISIYYSYIYWSIVLRIDFVSIYGVMPIMVFWIIDIIRLYIWPRYYIGRNNLEIKK